ncbi:Spore coat protein U (SCPU) domain-containing protein [Pseudomonas delhiensis]|uniref:Spore coat protein U (SCPU) domain-containing protein n=1 Tax=Pseudomonas delhiensis TaxID=366289 RepID=A0A239IXJ4_9PSED|nr:spore coat U domain-containing protein [Pseudomonas delhiensis]SDK12668.1 Spore coat protein U (SCPU) domain-containing protein [Pseudomonas delhiensis]SNS98340.1 Spore coat protein U (SCPU) domain-containing protein [Pseudomonas delhiensis]
MPAPTQPPRGPARPRRRALAALLLLLAHAGAQQAGAATQASFRVSASVTQGCLVSQAAPGSGNDFGRLDFGRHPSSTSGTISARLLPNDAITLDCTPGVKLRMTVDGGQHLDGGLRHLGAGQARLAYRLYRDAGLSQEIPVGASVPIDYSDAGAIALPINAALRLPGNQTAGRYHDRLTVTLSW